MEFFLLSLLIIAIKCQDYEYGCEDDCECPDIEDFFVLENPEDLLYTKEAGCVFNATCSSGKNGTLFSFWEGSEIPTPDNTASVYFLVNNGSEQFDMFSTFGVICEDGGWYMTKYPSGIEYWESNEIRASIGVNGEYDGLKSRIGEGTCY